MKSFADYEAVNKVNFAAKTERRYIEQGGALVDINAAHTLQARPPLSKAMFKTLLSNRMLWCAYIGQYCIIALSYFFHYLVSDLSGAGARLEPVMGGKAPCIVGMLMAASLVLSAIIPTNAGIIAIMSFAFFGKGVAVGGGTWTIVSDTALKEVVGLASTIFNERGIGNMAGFITPLLFGVIVGLAGSYSIGLTFVAAHCVIAALLFLLVMGPIERVGDEQNIVTANDQQQGENHGIKAV